MWIDLSDDSTTSSPSPTASRLNTDTYVIRETEKPEPVNVTCSSDTIVTSTKATKRRRSRVLQTLRRLVCTHPKKYIKSISRFKFNQNYYSNTYSVEVMESAAQAPISVMPTNDNDMSQPSVDEEEKTVEEEEVKSIENPTVFDDKLEESNSGETEDSLSLRLPDDFAIRYSSLPNLTSPSLDQVVEEKVKQEESKEDVWDLTSEKNPVILTARNAEVFSYLESQRAHLEARIGTEALLNVYNLVSELESKNDDETLNYGDFQKILGNGNEDLIDDIVQLVVADQFFTIDQT